MNFCFPLFKKNYQVEKISIFNILLKKSFKTLLKIKELQIGYKTGKIRGDTPLLALAFQHDC